MGTVYLARDEKLDRYVAVKRLGNAFLNAPRMKEKFYAPVLWLYDHTVLKPALKDHARLWGVDLDARRASPRGPHRFDFSRLLSRNDSVERGKQPQMDAVFS